MSEQKATEQPPADVPTVIEIPTGLQPPATSGYVQAVNKWLSAKDCGMTTSDTPM